jgi:hypothetical protein
MEEGLFLSLQLANLVEAAVMKCEFFTANIRLQKGVLIFVVVVATYLKASL